MKESGNIKIKISEFFQKHKLKIFIVVLIIIIVLLFNYLLSIYKKEEPIVTKDPFALVLQPESKVPSKVFIESEALIVNFAEKSSKGEYEDAYNMLSDDCKTTVFGDVEEFSKYAKTNFPKDSRYEVIPYSKVGSTYIYQVKVFEDFLATGLTYSDYSFIDLKMAINESASGKKNLSVAGYIGKIPLNSFFENDYIRVEIKQKISFYSEEIYDVTVTNRTENDIVLKEFTTETPEIQLTVSGDARPELSYTEKIDLSGHQTLKLNLSFARFFDEKELPNSLVFSAVRVIKKDKSNNYNADDVLAEFSVPVPIAE